MAVRGWLASLAGACVFGAALGAPASASAFCRTRTCGTESTPPCERDSNGCSITGAELFWPDASVRLWVEPAGSSKLGITGEQTRPVAEQALGVWLQSSCGGAPPSIGLDGVAMLTGEARAQLGLSEDPTGGASQAVTCANAPVDLRTSVLEFVDENWSHPSAHAIALTTVSFCTRSGRILGADIELNSEQFRLTLPDEPADFDLLAVLTHEAGHFYGLDDLPISGLTMSGMYGGGGDLSPRTLEADDEAGMCTVYPPGRFDQGCGCRVTGGVESGLSWLAVAVAGALWARRRRSALEARKHVRPAFPREP